MCPPSTLRLPSHRGARAANRGKGVPYGTYRLRLRGLTSHLGAPFMGTPRGALPAQSRRGRGRAEGRHHCGRQSSRPPECSTEQRGGTPEAVRSLDELVADPMIHLRGILASLRASAATEVCSPACARTAAPSRSRCRPIRSAIRLGPRPSSVCARPLRPEGDRRAACRVSAAFEAAVTSELTTPARPTSASPPNSPSAHASRRPCAQASNATASWPRTPQT